jgi:hypothetical protein
MFSVYEIKTFDPVIKGEDFNVDNLSSNKLAIQVHNYSNNEMIDSYPATAKKANLIIKRDANEMPIVHPIWLEGLEISVQSAIHRPYNALDISVDTLFPDASAIAPLGTYTFVIVKKGVPFNERNTWTISVEVTRDITVAEVVQKLVDQLDNLKLGLRTHELAYPDWTIYITDGSDYAIYGADNLLGINSIVNGNGADELLYSDCKALIQKGIADRGINDTYVDGAAILYPTMFGFAKSKVFDDNDKVNLVCIRSKEPRMMGTHDEVIRQVIYLIVPTDIGFDVDLNEDGNTITLSIGNAIAKVLTAQKSLNGTSHTSVSFNGVDI